MHGPTVDGHLDGAALVRFLDGEGPAADRARADDHLRRCHACAADLRLLRTEAERVSGWLRRHDHARQATDAGATAGPVGVTSAAAAPEVAARLAAARGAAARGAGGAARGLPTWLKAAAAVLLVTAPAVAVPGVRDWVVERVAGPAAVADREVAATSSPAAASAPSPRRVRFVPSAGVFTVRFDAVEPGGTLRLGRADADEAVLTLESDAEAVVSSALLRIRNGPAAPGVYGLLVPSGTRAVRVVVEGREVTIDAGALDRGVVIPLSRGDGG